jgi:hypothetical protein
MTIDVSITMLGAVSRVTPQFGESLTIRTTIDNFRGIIYDYNIFNLFIVQAPDLVRLVKLVIIIDDYRCVNYYTWSGDYKPQFGASL